MNITDENFEKETNSTDKFVLVDFFATWCEPCSVLGPILEKVVKEFPAQGGPASGGKDKITLIKANVDDVPQNAQKFGVEKIPMVVLLKNGKLISSFVGVVPENTIKEWLENAIKQ